MRVIVSASRHASYLPYWPAISIAWRKLFGPTIQMTLAFIDASTEGVEVMQQYGEVIYVKPVPGIPMASQALMARFWVTRQFGDDLCTINDVDLMPLQAKYFNDILAARPKGHLLCVGREVYDDTSDKGKFPAAYLTGEASLISSVVNPKNLDFPAFMQSFVGVKVFDAKEDVMSRYPHGHPDCFSDESLLRLLIHQADPPQFHVPRGWSPYTERAIDRAAWKWDEADLLKGRFIEAHLPHPFNRAKIATLLRYVNSQGK